MTLAPGHPEHRWTLWHRGEVIGRYATDAEASAEALRLSRLALRKTFYVMPAGGAVDAPKPPPVWRPSPQRRR